MRSKGRYLFFILMAVVWMGAACMLLGILLTRQHIPQKTMAQVTKAPIEKKTAYLTFDDGPSVLTRKLSGDFRKESCSGYLFCDRGTVRRRSGTGDEKSDPKRKRNRNAYLFARCR